MVRIQWRPRGQGRDTVERHAVVVDPDGFLLLAGPGPSPAGTLAATLEDGRSMPAEVWARDPETCLTMLRVPVPSLPALEIRGASRPPPDAAAGAPSDPPPGQAPPAPAASAPSLPERLPPGFPFVMVTAEGAIARGALRASHRHRLVDDPVRAGSVDVTCLDEAALHVVPTDLGAPWLDAEGRLVGLLVGAEIRPPAPPGTTDDELRIRPEVVAAFAVPADVLRVVVPLLKGRREVPRAALGVFVRRLSDAVCQHVCPEGGGGFLVVDLDPDGPAARAEILPRDLLVRVDGRPLARDADLADVLLPHRPGDRIRVGLLRRGEPRDADVLLGRAP